MNIQIIHASIQIKDILNSLRMRITQRRKKVKNFTFITLIIFHIKREKLNRKQQLTK